MTVDMKQVEEKLAKNEPLNKEELKEVMSMPPDGMSNMLPAQDEISEEDFHEEQPTKKEEPPAKKEEAKKAEEPPAKKEEEDTDPVGKLQRELDKPDGQEDLSGLSQREKAYFWEMRRLRRRAQKAEDDRDVLKFNQIKQDKANKDESKEEQIAEEDPFKDRTEDEAITVKDAKALLKKIQDSGKRSPKDTDGPVFDPRKRVVTEYIKLQEQLVRKEFEDYDEVTECAPEIISNNPAYLKQIADALVKGENVAKLSYNLIKGDPEFTKVLPIGKARSEAKKPAAKKDSEPAAQQPSADEKKTKEALEKQKQLEQNQNHPKTAAHGAGSGGASEEADTIDGYMVTDLLNMSDSQFAKIKKETRQKFLRRYGA